MWVQMGAQYHAPMVPRSHATTFHIYSRFIHSHNLHMANWFNEALEAKLVGGKCSARMEQTSPGTQVFGGELLEKASTGSRQ